MKKQSSEIKKVCFPGSRSDFSLSKRETHANSSLHTHAFFEFELYLSGKGTIRVNHHETAIQPGVGVLLAPTDYHQILLEETVTLLNLSFTGNAVPKPVLDRILAKRADSYFTVTEDDAKTICKLFDIALAYRASEAAFDDGFADQCTEALLTLVLRYVLPGTKRKKDTAVLNALSYIHANLREDLSLEQIADAVKLTPTYLSTVFKNTTGDHLKAYILKARVSFAQRLIRYNGLSATEACFAAGFNTYSSFLRAFKKYTGMSPAEYAGKEAL